MIYLVLDKETDELVDTLHNVSQEFIEEYELKNTDTYITDEKSVNDIEFDEDDVDFSDIW